MNTFDRRKLSLLAAAVAGLWTVGGVQAATLTCGTPVRVTTTPSVATPPVNVNWRSDARFVDATGADTTPAGHPVVVGGNIPNYISQYWNYTPPAAIAPGAAWLTHGVVQQRPGYSDTYGHFRVDIQGDRSKGAWVANRATMIYNEPITIGPEVDLSSIRVTGRGSVDNNSGALSVMAHTLPGGVDNTAAAQPWVQSTALSGIGAWNSATGGAFDLQASASGLGFYYGDNSIGLTFNSERYNDSLPGGIIADFEITADCLTPPAAQPTAALICPDGNRAGDTVRIGPFTTNARDWKWTWRTNAAGTAIENVEQPLYDDYMYRDYFRPAALPAGQETAARWISPGTTSPAGADVPGVPYPAATGQAKGSFYGTVFTLNQPLMVGNNVDLSTIRFDGRFGFDDTGDSVFVKPASLPAYTPFAHLLPDGFGSFTQATTAPIPGFLQGQNTIGLVLNGGQNTNDCGSGVCALGAIADFYVTATCTGLPPIAIDPNSPTSVPTLDVAGLGLLGLLSAGAGAVALRRRKRAQ